MKRVEDTKHVLPDVFRKRLRNFFAEKHLDEEISFSKRLIKYQKKSIIGLLFILVVYFIFGSYFSDFNFSSLWIRTDDIFGSVLKYWYVFAWGFGISLLTLSSVSVGSFVKAKTIFNLDIITSVLAGLWEEIGYRGLFIFMSMITLMFANFAFKWIVIIVFFAFFLWAIYKLLTNKLWLFAIIVGVIAYLLMHWWSSISISEDPLYWIYRNIILPFMSFISFRLLDPIIYNKNFSFLFIIAAMSANLKFRDGHKYQGTFGYFNSWIVGYILLHAMMYYGLLVAIIIHAVYDIIIGLMSFSKRLVYSRSR